MKRAVTRRLIFKFLDTKYPDAYIKQTIFGDLPVYGNDWVIRKEVCSELCRWFGISDGTAIYLVIAWESKLPVVVSIRNSTNPDVLVSDTITVNSTL